MKKKALLLVMVIALFALGACDTKTEDVPQDLWVKIANSDGTYYIENSSFILGSYSDLVKKDAPLTVNISCSDECRFAIELIGADGKPVQNDNEKKVKYTVDMICSDGEKHKVYAYMHPGEDCVKLQRPDDYWVRGHLAKVEWMEFSIKKSSNEEYSYSFTVESSNLSSLLGEE